MSAPDSLPSTKLDTSPAAQLEALFGEVVTFVNHLRQAQTSIHRQNNLRAGALGILQALAKQGPRTVSQIARMRLTSRQNIQILVNHLAATGHVGLTTNPAHKRASLVVLTDSGRNQLAAAQAREDRFLAELAAEVSGSEVRVAAHLLGRLREILSGARGGEQKAHRKEPPTSPAPPPPAGRVRHTEPEPSELPYNLL